MAHNGRFELTVKWLSGSEIVLLVTSREPIFDIKKSILKKWDDKSLELGQIILTKLLDDNSGKYIILESFDVHDTYTLLKANTLATYGITEDTTINIIPSEFSTRLHTSVFLQKLIDGMERDEITTYKTGTSEYRGQLIKEEDSQALCDLNGWGKIGSSISFATSSTSDSSTKEYTYTKKQIKISLSTMYSNTDPTRNSHRLTAIPERLCTIKTTAPAKSLIIIGNKRFVLEREISLLQRFPYDELEIKGDLYGIRGETETIRSTTPGVRLECNVALCAALKRININHEPVSVHYVNQPYIDQLIQQYTLNELLSALCTSDKVTHYFNFVDIAPYISTSKTNANSSSPNIIETIVADPGYIPHHPPIIVPGFAYPDIARPADLERRLLVGNYRVLDKEHEMATIRAAHNIAGHPHERSTPKKLHQYTTSYGRTKYGTTPTRPVMYKPEDYDIFSRPVLGNPKRSPNTIGHTRKLHSVPFTQKLDNINENANSLVNPNEFINMENPRTHELPPVPFPNRGNQSKRGSIIAIKKGHNNTRSKKQAMPIQRDMASFNYNQYGMLPHFSHSGAQPSRLPTDPSGAASGSSAAPSLFSFSPDTSGSSAASSSSGASAAPSFFSFSANPSSASASGAPIMPLFGSSAAAANGPPPPPLTLSRSGGKRKGHTHRKHHIYRKRHTSHKRRSSHKRK